MGVEVGALAAYAAVASAAVGAGTAIYSATQNKAASVKDAVLPGAADASNAQADDSLRRRSRQGSSANMLSGTGGAGNVGATSTGQKTLLGG